MGGGSSSDVPVISDRDGDLIADTKDNCPDVANADQLNTDGDQQGNACDSDDDNDGWSDDKEASAGTNSLKADSDQDGVKDSVDQYPMDASKALGLKEAHRLLLQASFGPTQTELARVQTMSAAQWVDEQLNASSAYDSEGDAHQTHLERTQEIAIKAEPSVNWYETAVFNQKEASFSLDDYQMAAWWENAIGLHPEKTLHGRDQLRQRVAYALSQLLVVSAVEAPLYRRGEGLANYYDMLARHAFGNYRDLLGEMARSPVMGVYLSHQGNRKADSEQGTTPDENFARELMQLFTVGLYELNLDGSANRDGDPASYPDTGTQLVPTYTETDISELSKVMTGWDLVDNKRYGVSASTQGDYTKPMEFTASEHEDELAEGGDGQVTVLNQSFALNAGRDGSGMDAALDILFQHPNTAPLVSKHLIMRLVTSNPSYEYVARVAKVFVNNGQNVRGDLKAVVRAILLDAEARDLSLLTPNSGKIKEPLIALAQLFRALGAVPLDGWISRDKSTSVNGVYWYKAPQSDIGQAALRSPSVFNFYTPDYVPSSGYFSERGLVSPEMKILTDQNLLAFNNVVYLATESFEKNKITRVSEKTLLEVAQSKQFWTKLVLLTNFDEALALLTQSAGGDLDNLESSKTAERPYKTAATNTVINYFDQLLLGGDMPATMRAALVEYLMNSSATNRSSSIVEAQQMIKDTVRMIATSSVYMVQK